MTEQQERQHEAMPEWYRTLSDVRDDEGAPRELRDQVRDALTYVDRLRSDRLAMAEVVRGVPAGCSEEHWVPVEVPWSAVEPGDVILAPPRGADIVGTPHMILRAATKHDGTRDARWVQAVGGGEVEPRNAKRWPEDTITVLMPVELARARAVAVEQFGAGVVDGTEAP